MKKTKKNQKLKNDNLESKKVKENLKERNDEEEVNKKYTVIKNINIYSDFKIIGVKKINNILYAHIEYNDKGEKKEGIFETQKFRKNHPEKLLDFYESKISFF